MDGIHDMGGMMGFGPVEPEADEPVFHALWEARLFALSQTADAAMPWTIDADRHTIEAIAPARYLKLPYYAKWLVTMETLMVRYGTMTTAELRTGRVEAMPEPLPVAKSPEVAVDCCFVRNPYQRDVATAPLFAAGRTVRTRNIHPQRHTRLPRYLRGHEGEIVRHHGAHVFPDTNAHGGGENPQHLYTVRFSARDLWGDDQRNGDHVMADLWEPYLDHA